MWVPKELDTNFILKKKKRSPTKCLDLYFPPSINRDLELPSKTSLHSLNSKFYSYGPSNPFSSQGVAH